MRAIWIIAIGGLLLFGYAYLGFPLGDPFGRNKLTNLHEELSVAVASELPPGSTINQVEQFLDERDLKFKTYDFLGVNSFLSRNRPDLVDEVKFETNASLYDVMNMVILKAGLNMFFFYDDERRLVWAYVETGSN